MHVSFGAMFFSGYMPRSGIAGSYSSILFSRVAVLLLLFSLSRVQLFMAPWTVAREALLSLEFSRQESWSRVSLPPPGDLPEPGMEPGSSAMAGEFFTLHHLGSPVLVH